MVIMKLLLALVGLGCLSSQVFAIREGDIIEEHLGKRTAIGDGCSWCSVGPWKIDTGMYIPPKYSSSHLRIK